MYKHDDCDTVIASRGKRRLVNYLLVLTAFLALIACIPCFVLLVRHAAEQRSRVREQKVNGRLRIGVPGHRLNSIHPPLEPGGEASAAQVAVPLGMWEGGFELA